MPFFTALLAFIFLKEQISLNVWISIFIATIGIIMSFGNSGRKFSCWIYFWYYFFYWFFCLLSNFKMAKETPKFTTVAFAGFFCFVLASLVILFKGQVLFSSSFNSSMFSLHGTLVCFGLILYSIGSKAIPAAELTLLSLTEVIGGIFWVWLPYLVSMKSLIQIQLLVGFFYLYLYFIIV